MACAGCRSAKLLRTGKTADKRAAHAVVTDPDAVRARRSTANRILTILKAALNHAFREGKVVSDEPWRKLKPFREADAAVIQYLFAAECIRLVNACQGPFRDLVCGALVTGCRSHLPAFRHEGIQARIFTAASKSSDATAYLQS